MLGFFKTFFLSKFLFQIPIYLNENEFANVPSIINHVSSSMFTEFTKCFPFISRAKHFYFNFMLYSLLFYVFFLTLQKYFVKDHAYLFIQYIPFTEQQISSTPSKAHSIWMCHFFAWIHLCRLFIGWLNGQSLKRSPLQFSVHLHEVRPCIINDVW